MARRVGSFVVPACIARAKIFKGRDAPDKAEAAGMCDAPAAKRRRASDARALLAPVLSHVALGDLKTAAAACDAALLAAPGSSEAAR